MFTYCTIYYINNVYIMYHYHQWRERKNIQTQNYFYVNAHFIGRLDSKLSHKIAEIIMAKVCSAKPFRSRLIFFPPIWLRLKFYV